MKMLNNFAVLGMGTLLIASSTMTLEVVRAQDSSPEPKVLNQSYVSIPPIQAEQDDRLAQIEDAELRDSQPFGAQNDRSAQMEDVEDSEVEISEPLAEAISAPAGDQNDRSAQTEDSETNSSQPLAAQPDDRNAQMAQVEDPDSEVSESAESTRDAPDNPDVNDLEALDPEESSSDTMDSGDSESDTMDSDTMDSDDSSEDDSSESELSVDPGNADRLLMELQANPNPLTRPIDPEQVTTEAVKLTLTEALEIAESNNTDIRLQQLQVELQQAALRQQQALLFPTLSFSASGTRTETDTNSLQTAGSSSIFSASDTNTRVTSLTGTVQLDYDIFDPDRGPSIRAAKRQLRQSELILEQVLEDLRLTVTEVYYDLQEADEGVRIAEQAVRAAERSLQDAQSLERAGVGTRFAVLQAEVQLAIEQQDFVNAKSVRLQARRALAELLNLPSKVNPVAADPVQKAGAWDFGLEESIIFAFQNRAELEQRLVERDIADELRKASRAGTLPTLTFTGLFALDQDFNNNVNETSFGGATQSESFTNQYQIGVNLTWPFFDGGASRAAARQQELNEQIAEVQFEDDRNLIRQEVENAFFDLNANLQNITTSQRGVEQATEALRLARLRFQAGVGTQIDVINAERDLTDAEGNLVSAIVGYNRALVEIQRAVSDDESGF